MGPSGRQERSLASVASTCREEAVNWTLSGPRTAKWCVEFLSIEGIGLEGHHERMRTVCKLEPSTWGVQEHFQLTQIMRQALQSDQIDPCNCLFVEITLRRMQTIEYSHGERAKEAESRGVGGRLSLEEQHAFGGIVRQVGCLMICPALLDHVKTEVEKEASLQKNLRKVREERGAVKKEAAGNKKKKKEEDP
jgi:hypothetical protein